MRLPKKYLSNIPLLALIAANVIPLFGAIFWSWDAFNIVFLYWAENVAVGFYTILKMAYAKVPGRASKKFTIAGFIFHYGWFTAGHGFCVVWFFAFSGREEAAVPTFLWKTAASVMSPQMMGALLALFLSHGVSFVRNYLLKGEFASAHLDKLFFSPYPRMFVMHVAICAGMYLTERFGSPLGLLAVLIVLKTALDMIGHQREHEKAKAHALELVNPISVIRKSWLLQAKSKRTSRARI
ncbi:MAG: DUF6498-containing protein [Planctomycetota bacterium]|jgi:hypothetical protein